MPIINVKLAKPALSKCEKTQLISDLTELFEKKYNKARERIVVLLEDVEAHDIAFGGKSVEVIKEEIAAKNCEISQDDALSVFGEKIASCCCASESSSENKK